MASINELSSYRLEKSKKNIEVVKLLIEDEYYNFAINRAYYAAFDAMRAVNALDGFDSSKHSGVIAHFNQNYIKTGLFDSETSKIIKKASTLREKSDYEDFFEATRKDAEEAYESVCAFINSVEKFLKNNHVLSLEDIKDLLMPIIKKYEIKSLSVFGSYARNEARPESDVDILIDGGNYHGLIEYMTMIDEMKAALGREVDVVTQESLHNSRSKADQLLKNSIERDRLLLI